MTNGVLNTTQTLIHMLLERKTKKIIVIDSSDDKENKKRRMRKRKNIESVDEISQGHVLSKKNEKNCKLFLQKQNKEKQK